ncbi:hypothetical protein H0H93_012044 [Arthromyces matolae]|nr:hypothetical protein H0H93_012044 [Arthromyces matolae]
MPPRAAKPSVSAPVPKARTLNGQLANILVNAVFNVASPTPAPVAASGSSNPGPSTIFATPPASPKKRKQTQVVESPDSVVVTETPSPKKKKPIAAVIESPVIRAFENMTAADFDTPRPTRARVKTEKALAAESAQKSSARMTTGRRAPPKVTKLASPIELTDTEEDLPPVPRFDDHQEAVGSFIDDEAIEDEDAVEESNQYSDDEIAEEMQDFIVPDDDDADDADDEDNQSISDHSATSVVAKRSTVAADVFNEPLTPPEPPAEVEQRFEIDENPPAEVLAFLQVMDPSLQEEMMKPTYVGLPILDHVFHTRPYHYDATGYIGRVPFANIGLTAEKMSEENAKSFFSCLRFEISGRYVNGARAAPQLVQDIQRRLCLAGSGAACVLMTVGVVSASHLIESSITTGGQYPYEQHRLTIMKFQQEAQRENAFIAQTFNMYSGVLSTTSKIGFSYVTRGSDKSTQYGNNQGIGPANATLADSSDFTNVAIPAMPVVHSVTSRRPFVEFNELVPIFDGRAETGEPFRFRPEDFNRLGSWRPWERHQKELPLKSVVAIGYSASHFEGRENGYRYLTPNILFVIVLHIPTRVMALVKEPSLPIEQEVNTKGKAKAKGKGKGKAKAK